MMAGTGLIAPAGEEPVSRSGASRDRTVSPTSSGQVALAAGLELQRIGDGVYVIAHRFPFLCNSLLVEMADGTLVLAGTPCTPEAMQHVLDWTRGHFGERRIVAINNGYHVDNLGGNRALLDAGIPVHGSDLTVRLLAERGEITRHVVLGFIPDRDSLEYQVHATQEFFPPDHIFPASEGLTLVFGGEEVRAICPGPTQAPDKVLIHFPGRRLLYGGCAVLAGTRAGNTAEADVGHWAEALRGMLDLPLDVVVPAHGERLDPGLLQHTIDLLERHGAAHRPAPDFQTRPLDPELTAGGAACKAEGSTTWKLRRLAPEDLVGASA